MRARSWVFFVGLGLCVVASIPIAFIVAAVQADGGWAFIAVVLAVFTSPLLAFWFLGPRLILFAARGVPVPGGNIWRWRYPPQRGGPPPQGGSGDTIEGEFERRD